MTNLEMAIEVLAAHREARQWADEAVARDMLDRFGIDADGEVKGDEPEVEHHDDAPQPAVSQFGQSDPEPSSDH